MKRSSPFRFLSSNRPGQYSVQRVDTPIGHVTKNENRIHGLTFTAGWTPGTLSGIDLATEPTREAAARALWSFHQAVLK